MTRAKGSQPTSHPTALAAEALHLPSLPWACFSGTGRPSSREPSTEAAWACAALLRGRLAGGGRHLSTPCLYLCRGRVSRPSTDTCVFHSQLGRETQRGMFRTFGLRELSPPSESRTGGTAVREGSWEEAKSEQSVSGWGGTNRRTAVAGGGGAQVATLGRAKSLSGGRGLNPAVHTETPRPMSQVPKSQDQR